eukprot:11215183-Lingulodinium_polyedra.AAC.1
MEAWRATRATTSGLHHFCEHRTTEAAAYEDVQTPHARRRCTAGRAQRAKTGELAQLYSAYGRG